MPSQIKRRQFLQAGALGTAAVVVAGCSTERRVRLEPYVTPPEDQVTGVATWYATTCRMCPAGCGVIARVLNGRAQKLEGNPNHPINQGRLCARGQAGVQLLYNPDRLNGPQTRTSRDTTQWQTAKWDDAINTLASKIQGAGNGVAAWLGSTSSGHLYDLFGRLIKAVGGGAPLMFDLYTGLLGYKTLSDVQNSVFGSNGVPAFDISTADVILSFGSNILGPTTSQVRYGVDFGSFRSQPFGKRGFLVQFEPRRSLTGAKADRWVPIKPGTEGMVALAIARIMADQNLGGDRAGRAKSFAGSVDVNAAANAAGVTVEELTAIAKAFANASKAVAIAGSFITGLDRGQDALSAVHGLNMIAGGNQPTGLIPDAAVPAGFTKNIPASFADARGLVDQMNSGAIKVLLVHGANPAYDLPPAFHFADAVKKVPFVVSFNPIMDETSALADMILPDRTYLEAWGYEVVTPNFGTPLVDSQQPVVPPVFDSKATGDILLAVAQKIPAAASQMNSKDEVAFIKQTITKLPPGAAGGSGTDVLWSRFLQSGGWWPASPPSNSAPAAKLSSAPNLAAPNYEGDPNQYPYFLHPFISDTVSDGRGASIPWLQATPDPLTTMTWQTWVEIHPKTADKLGVQDGDVVRVTSPNGSIEAPVYRFPIIREDTIGIPTGQGHTQYGRYAANRGSNVMQLIGGSTVSTGNVNWQGVRVKIDKTGRSVRMPVFEFTQGVETGFPKGNPFPGE